jgi:hypothetical protein
MPDQYRPKDAGVEAIQVDCLDYDGMCEIVTWCGGTAVDGSRFDEDARMAGVTPVIAIPDGNGGLAVASCGDWIVKGAGGVFRPMRPDVFEATYEEIEGQ